MRMTLVLSPLEVLTVAEAAQDPGDEQQTPPPDEGGTEQPER
jgi:hypothetical protein